jgi:predicted nucleotidyltransferase
MNVIFTTAERTSIRADLLAQAHQDQRIVSGAITGSAASGREDDRSDIDLAFGIATGISLTEVLSDWTAHMYDQNAAVHHVDTPFGN